ncbi:thermonuclease family protein [Thiomicrorhabdus xiamenensis]|uniref:Thermonuclease family protein n=1 Tax=Thiomicrorhabdus xiamenensis TaxID=2739063 RepID=A0A7D4NMK2_9GAMM|nr:thermonuclease family protein [Thiomicrorhabdus xiamenensis]QKI90094.1 thermonuclease family protein [Thiomicrorhabdus xiamenensis]
MHTKPRFTNRLLLTPLLLLTFLPTFQASAQENCRNLEPDVWVEAQYAINGSTIIVQNQRVHLIGLYTPQKARTYKFHTPGEPLAKAAQEHLNTLLANHNLQIGVVYDKNQVDKNRIQQAHVFFKNGNSLNEAMLRSGYAINRTQNDNTRYAECYYAAEQQARQEGYQLWDQLQKNPNSHFPLVKSSEITDQDQGFRIIQGKILEVRQSSTNYILNMDTTGVRIPKKAWDKFDYAKLQALNGQTVEVRGYAYLYKGHMYMVIDHPYAFDVFSPLKRS